MSLLREFLWAVAHILFYTIGAVAAGALLGAIIFPLVGSALGMDLTLSEMVLNGIRDGGFYLLMWGFGGAVVYTVIQLHDRRHGTNSLPWRKSKNS